MIFLMLYLFITVGLYEEEYRKMPYGFLDPGNTGAAAVYLGMMIAHIGFFVLMWALANARTRYRGGPAGAKVRPTTQPTDSSGEQGPLVRNPSLGTTDTSADGSGQASHGAYGTMVKVSQI